MLQSSLVRLLGRSPIFARALLMRQLVAALAGSYDMDHAWEGQAVVTRLGRLFFFACWFFFLASAGYFPSWPACAALNTLTASNTLRRARRMPS
jgi:hypothetical protein